MRLLRVVWNRKSWTPGSRSDCANGGEQAAGSYLDAFLSRFAGSRQGVTRSNYGAPLILVLGCHPADAWVRRYDGKNGAEADAAIVATYLMLAAETDADLLWYSEKSAYTMSGVVSCDAALDEEPNSVAVGENAEVILTPAHFRPGLSGQIENKPYTFLLKTGRVVNR